MDLPDTPDWTEAAAISRSRSLLFDLICDYLERDILRVNCVPTKTVRFSRRRGFTVDSWRLDRSGNPGYIIGRAEGREEQYAAVDVNQGVIRFTVTGTDGPQPTFTARCTDKGKLRFADPDDVLWKPWQVSRAILERVIFP